MNSYDAWKEGRYETEKPQDPIEEKDTWENLTEAYESGHEYVFKEKQAEILDDLKMLLDIAEAMDWGVHGGIERLINKCK
jgi:hypothetical protein